MSGHHESAAPAIGASNTPTARMAWDFKENFLRKKDGVEIINIGCYTSANAGGL
jgi:hypothetical protein